MKRVFLFTLIIFGVSLMTCSQFDPHAMLTQEQVNALLQQAKAQSAPATEDKILNAAEISAVLEKVKATPAVALDVREAAILETNLGVIVIAFYPEVAPEHCKSFKRLVTAGFYDHTRFHRILDTFVIQGGDILTRDADPDNDGTGGPGYTVPAEFNGIPHDLGILSMARSSDPNSAGSQFFICLSRERTQALDGKYTVFGKVIGGLDVVQKIGKVQTTANKYGEPSSPVEPVYINQAYMITR